VCAGECLGWREPTCRTPMTRSSTTSGDTGYDLIDASCSTCALIGSFKIIHDHRKKFNRNFCPAIPDPGIRISATVAGPAQSGGLQPWRLSASSKVNNRIIGDNNLTDAPKHLEEIITFEMRSGITRF